MDTGRLEAGERLPAITVPVCQPTAPGGEFFTPVLSDETDLEALGYWGAAIALSAGPHICEAGDRQRCPSQIPARQQRHAGLAAACLLHLAVAGLISAAPAERHMTTREDGGVVVSVTVFGTAPENSLAAPENVTKTEPANLPEMRPAETPQKDPEIVSRPEPLEMRPVEPVPEPLEILATEQPAKEVAPSRARPAIDKPAPEVTPVGKPETREDEEELGEPKADTRPERKEVAASKLEPKPEPDAEAVTKAETAKKPAARKKTAARNEKTAADKSAVNARKGDATAKAVKAAKQLASNGDAKNRETGNARIGNYLGKINKQLARAKRKARGEGKGTAIVGFVIDASGTISGLRLVASSGKPTIDKAALSLVRKAAPFPPIPADAGRTSWPMQVPIEFR